MRNFAQTAEAVAATTKKSEKVRLVADYLRSLPLEEAARAAIFFTGRTFPRNDSRTLSVGGALLSGVVAELTGADASKMHSAYRSHGDLGAMAAQLWPLAPRGPRLSLTEIAEAFDKLTETRGSSPKAIVLRELFQRADAAEAKYIIKIITGDLRIGLKESLVEEAVAQAYQRPFAAVARANMMCGDISETVRLAAEDRLADAALQLFQPVSFMLASPVDTADDLISNFPEGAVVEDKFDGIRAQAHKKGARVEMYSRTLSAITEFPELVPALAAIPGEFVIDGEIVPWREGRPIAFTEFQTRLGRKQSQISLWPENEIPVRLMAFDLIQLNGRSLFETPLQERRELLHSLFASAPAVIGSHIETVKSQICRTVDEVTTAFEAAFDHGNEGIMAKGPDSPYAPGRRVRHWLKLKRPLATLDVVVTAVEYGHGKRHGWLSDYTFAVSDGGRLVNIGKAYSGLTDAEILELTPYFAAHAVEDQGHRLLVDPTIVIEVAFNNIQRSARHDSGFALRFPRIVRLRPDKTVSEIDTLQRVQQLFDLQHAASAKIA
jgi:DNA ligase 1